MTDAPDPASEPDSDPVSEPDSDPVSDPVPDPIPDPDEVRVSIEHAARPRGPQGGTRPPYGAPARTHLPDDTVLSWRPRDLSGVSAYAIDAEYADRALPRTLARRYGGDDFWTRWTRAEVCAKLTDTPILLWIDTYGLPADPAGGTGLRVHSFDLTGIDGRTIRVSTGTARTDDARTDGARTDSGGADTAGPDASRRPDSLGR